MYEMGANVTANPSRRSTERQRSDIAVAVAMAAIDGAEFERLLGAEKAMSSHRGGNQRNDSADSGASTARDASTRSDRAGGNDRYDETSRAARDDRAQGGVEEKTPGNSGRAAAKLEVVPMPQNAKAGGAEYRAANAAGSAVSGVDDPEFARYAKLLEDLKAANLETAKPTAQDLASPRLVEAGETAASRLAALPADGDLGPNTGFDPAAQLMKSLAQGADPFAATKTAAVPEPQPESTLQLEQQVRAQVVDQLAGQLGGLGGKGSLKLILTPPELGRVEIRFTRDGDKLQLHFRVETAAAARALQDGSGHLQDMLLNRNGHWQQIDVTVERDEDEEEASARQQETDQDEPADQGDEERDHNDEQRGEA
jgi:flagellar hook-length control protein FliK